MALSKLLFESTEELLWSDLLDDLWLRAAMMVVMMDMMASIVMIIIWTDDQVQPVSKIRRAN